LNILRIRAVARKELVHIIRDPRSLGMSIAIPMMMLLLFGYALTLDVDNVPLVAWDQDGTHASREFLSRFTGSPYFSLWGHIDSYRELEEAVDSGQALAALVIPAGFAGKTEAGRVVPVQLIVDGSDSNTAAISIGYAQAITALYSRDIALQELRRVGISAVKEPLDTRTRIWFNPQLESKNFIIPGLIAVIMMIIAALLTSLTIAREWERGTMEQLISTPVKVPELIAGKLIPYFSIGLFDVLLAVLMGEFLFQVPLRGSVGLLFAMAAIFLVGALSLGILISITTRNQLLASQLAIVTTFLPTFLLSGFVYAIGNMPQAIQIVTYIIPARYFMVILKGIYLKGIGLEILWVEAGLLTLFGILMIVIANVKFRKKLV